MRKIAYVLPRFPVLSETFVSTEIRAMQRSGHHIVPVAFEHHDGKYQLRDEDLKKNTLHLSDVSKLAALKALPYLRSSMFKAIDFALKQNGLSFKSLLGNALKLAYLARRESCNHFHAHFAQATAATAIVAARLCGATVSFVGHGYDVYATPEDLELKLNTADFVVAVCEDMSRYFQMLAPKANVSLIYCGVDVERFQRIKVPSRETVNTGDDEHPAPAKERKLLFVGRLCETKGLFTLLKALASIPHYNRPCLDIVGDGILKNELASYVRDCQLTEHVKFLGAKQSSWLIFNSHHYDAVVLPFEKAPNGDRDTGPVVVKEAMALRLPVITTFFMGCNEILTQTSALRVPTNNPAALSTAITKFLRMDDNAVTQMIDNAYFRVMSLYSAQLQAACLSHMVERHAPR